MSAVSPGSLIAARAFPGLLGSADYSASEIYMSQLARSQTSSQAGTGTSTGTIYFQPFMCTFAHTFTAIGFVNGASVNTQKFHLGIYNSLGRLPNGLLVDGGEITVADANANTARESVISQALQANTLYWLAFTGNTNAPSCICPATDGDLEPAMDIGCLNSFSIKSMMPTMTQAYAALPAAFVKASRTLPSNLPWLYLKG